MEDAYTDCELRYIGKGYDPEEAVEMCAKEEDRSGSEGEKPKEDISWEDY